MASEPAPFRLSKAQAAFIESGVSIVAASRDLQMKPLLGHAAGCVVAADGQQVTVYLSGRKYPLLIDAVRRSGAIAVTFSEPSSNESVQIKGNSAALVALERGDEARIAAYLDLFAADLERIGHRGVLGRTALACATNDLVAIRFIPTVAFSQTPGPAAGRQIGT